jgi:Lrp/AsnC family transcriptional regulator, involved in the regulation of lysine biosynthesis
MDEIDKQILKKLEENARTPFLTISKELDVSEGTIRKRVTKLLKNNTIKKFTIETKSQTTAIIGIEINPHKPTSDIVKELQKLEISKIYEIAGRFDLMCFIKVKNMEVLNETIERIRITKGIEHTETFTILKEN